MDDNGSDDQIVSAMADENMMDIANTAPHPTQHLSRVCRRGTNDYQSCFLLDDTADKLFAFVPQQLTSMTRADCPDQAAISAALTFVTRSAIEPSSVSCLLTPSTLDWLVANYAALLASAATV
jgi:hypothetical protein